jgi:hypothetical protein
MAQSGLALEILLPQPPKYWDHSCAQPHPSGLFNFLNDVLYFSLFKFCTSFVKFFIVVLQNMVLCVAQGDLEF